MKSARESERDNFFTKVLEEINNDAKNGNWEDLKQIADMLNYSSLMCSKLADWANDIFNNRNKTTKSSNPEDDGPINL